MKYVYIWRNIDLEILGKDGHFDMTVLDQKFTVNNAVGSTK